MFGDFYLHLYSTTAAHDAVYEGDGYDEPWVALTEQTGEVTYNKAFNLTADKLFDRSCQCDGGSGPVIGFVDVSASSAQGPYTVALGDYFYESDVDGYHVWLAFDVWGTFPSYQMVDGALDTSLYTADRDYDLTFYTNVVNDNPTWDEVFTSIDGVDASEITEYDEPDPEQDMYTNEWHIVRENGVISVHHIYGTGTTGR